LNSQTHSAAGFVSAAQVSKEKLVELAAKAMAALEEFMQALTPADPEPPRKPVEIATRKNYTSTDKAIRAGNPPSPECGDETVRRTRLSNGSVFFGCINYPVCKAITDAQQFSTRKGAISQ
jgi:hypothetical protein